ncbi:MAG: hypothetical protein L0Y79_07985, partial [Chlorobi bacterium]|nr:hypothetical protein [Chlorobiota bacterium]
MATSNSKIEPSKPKKKRNLLSLTVLVFTILLFSLTLLVSITQTSVFRNLLKGYLVDTINEDFNTKESQLTIGEIEGNFFSEIIVKDAVVKVQNDEMIKLERRDVPLPRGVWLLRV